MQALYGLLTATGLVAVIWGVTWLGFKASKREGAAEERADATDLAREAEQEMTDIALQPTSPEETRRKLDEGQF